MEAAIDRIMMTYDLLMNRTAAASAEARAKVTDYVNTLFEAGERDTASPDRLRPDLFARARRLLRSGEGRIYRAISARFCADLPSQICEAAFCGAYPAGEGLLHLWHGQPVHPPQHS